MPLCKQSPLHTVAVSGHMGPDPISGGEGHTDTPSGNLAHHARRDRADMKARLQSPGHIGMISRLPGQEGGIHSSPHFHDHNP